jgi:hypothetical protein
MHSVYDVSCISERGRQAESGQGYVHPKLDCSSGSDPIDQDQTHASRFWYVNSLIPAKKFRQNGTRGPSEQERNGRGHSSRATTLYPVKYKGLFGYDGRHVYSVAHGPVW